jgi:hypothetical protein
MKTILITALVLWLYGSFELIKLLNEFNTEIAHGELLDTDHSLDGYKSKQLQRNAQ